MNEADIRSSRVLHILANANIKPIRAPRTHAHDAPFERLLSFDMKINYAAIIVDARSGTRTCHTAHSRLVNANANSMLEILTILRRICFSFSFRGIPSCVASGIRVDFSSRSCWFGPRRRTDAVCRTTHFDEYIIQCGRLTYSHAPNHSPSRLRVEAWYSFVDRKQQRLSDAMDPLLYTRRSSSHLFI